jgi:hypothetical protein
LNLGRTSGTAKLHTFPIQTKPVAARCLYREFVDIRYFERPKAQLLTLDFRLKRNANFSMIA